MSAGQQFHPSRRDLDAFAQGRLPPQVMEEVERHVATCDSCCQQLATVPDDTLLQLAREAATLTFHVGPPPKPSRPSPPRIPAELVDHPRYRVLGLIGTGGMGAVYKAQHRLMERLVALKVINPEFLQNAAAVDRFRREFRAVARLSHPNIVTAYDAEQAGNLHLLVMEFVEGVSLDQLVAQRGPLPIQQACQLIRQAALGLAHIHERGMVHRDIKPQNLMVSRQGNVKILDCGLARLGVEARSGSAAAGPTAAGTRTCAGMVLGTPDYMAPEQGIDAASADIRADIYSLGCTLFFAVTGQPPFPHGLLVEKLLAHAQRKPPMELLPGSVSLEFSTILTRMLAKDPSQRYQTPAELAADLEQLTPTPVGPATMTTTEPPRPQTAKALPVVLPAIGSRNSGGKKTSPRRSALVLAATVLLGLSALAAIPLTASWFGPSSRPDPGHNSSPAAPLDSLPRKVLLVIPRYGLWLADFEDVKESLQQHRIQVITASSELQPSELVPTSRRGVAKPDLLIDSPIDAADYGAIVFVGLRTEEYHPGSRTGDITARLLSDFRQKERLITAICGGQKALAVHGFFSGKRVAQSPYAAHTYRAAGALPQRSRIERDGRLITAAADTDAAAFGKAIAAALDRASAQRK